MITHSKQAKDVFTSQSRWRREVRAEVSSDRNFGVPRHKRTGVFLSENRYNSTFTVETNKDAIADLRLTAEALLQTVIQHQENFDLLVQEIRGLRTENRQILNHLFPDKQQGE